MCPTTCPSTLQTLNFPTAGPQLTPTHRLFLLLELERELGDGLVPSPQLRLEYLHLFYQLLQLKTRRKHRSIRWIETIWCRWNISHMGGGGKQHFLQVQNSWMVVVDDAAVCKTQKPSRKWRKRFLCVVFFFLFRLKQLLWYSHWRFCCCCCCGCLLFCRSFSLSSTNNCRLFFSLCGHLIGPVPLDGWCSRWIHEISDIKPSSCLAKILI